MVGGASIGCGREAGTRCVCAGDRWDIVCVVRVASKVDIVGEAIVDCEGQTGTRCMFR